MGNIRTMWLRDQLIMALRQAAGFPISTSELVVAMPSRIDRRNVHCMEEGRPHLSHNRDSSFHRIISCEPPYHTYSRQHLYGEIYPQLRALEVRGICHRISTSESRIYWVLLAETSAQSEIEALEKLLAQS